ncbi:MAG: cyclic peptide export ABC transporter [Pyrinomonadaceae bacterium]
MKNLLQLLSVVLGWSREIPRARAVVALATVSSLLAGIGYTGLIALVKTILSDGLTSEPRTMWTFFALCIIIPVCGFASQLLLMNLTARATYHLRVQLSRQILSAPLRLLERLGAHRLLATINQDIPTVIEVVTLVPQMLTQLAMMAGCLFYLGWLSWKLLLILLGYMTLGLLSHQLPLMRAFRYFRLLREQWDSMHKAIRGLIEGTKELKLNARRREAFLAQQLEPAARGIWRYGMRGNGIAMAVSNWGQILFFIFIGLLLFVTPLFVAAEPKTFIGYTLVVLFLITPLTMILNQIPALERAYVAAEKIKSLGLSLSARPPESLGAAPVADPDWRRLELADVTHTYRQESGEEFRLGPVSLTLSPGELVFITGGNGSGKTTLAKLLTGLYEPESGEIRVDGRPVTPEERDEYRQRFSVVFYDFYLFERLFGLEAADLDTRGQRYLDLLQLGHKLQIKDGALSTIELSQGQRKRLALLAAYLEDRPVYVFDEWASDQDPAFKQVFYYQLLPELKARGKAVVIISHDDRYYGLGDRLIKLESGRIEYDRPTVAPDEELRLAQAPLA